MGNNLLRPAHWDARGESLWSIVRKLAYVNELNGEDIKRCFYNDSTAPGFGKASVRSCATLNGVSDDAILLNTTLTKTTLPWSLPHSLVLGEGKISKRVRFCPDCSQLGFHSALFQVMAIDICPWHQVPLEDRCHLCSTQFSYEFGNEMLVRGFTCKCRQFRNPSSLPTPEDLRFRSDVIRDTRQLHNLVSKARSMLKLHSPTRVRLITDKTVRHDQTRILVSRTQPTQAKNICRLIVNDARNQRERISTRLSLRHTLSPDAKASLHELRKIWRTDNSGVKYHVLRHVDSGIFAAVRLARQTIRNMFLVRHADCWCLASNRQTSRYVLGVSCIWRATFEIWQHRHRGLLRGFPGKFLLDTNPYARSWLSIIEQFLVSPKKGWMDLQNVDVVLSIAHKITADALVRDFVHTALLLAKTLFSSDSSVKIAAPKDAQAYVVPKCETATYLVRLDNKKNHAQLLIDDEQVNLKLIAGNTNEGAHDADWWRRIGETLY